METPSLAAPSISEFVRYDYLQERIAAKYIQVSYKPTEDMLADILTKPLLGQSFFRIRNLLFYPTCNANTGAPTHKLTTILHCSSSQSQ